MDTPPFNFDEFDYEEVSHKVKNNYGAGIGVGAS